MLNPPKHSPTHQTSPGIASISGPMHKYLDRVAMHFEGYVLMPCSLLIIDGKLRMFVTCGSGVNCR